MTKIRTDRAWITFGVITAVLIAAISWFFFIAPQLDAKASAEQELLDTQMQNITLQQRINKLRSESEHLGDLQTELRGAMEALPAQHNLEAFTRQLTAQADDAELTVLSITPSAPIRISSSTSQPAPEESADHESPSQQPSDEPEPTSGDTPEAEAEAAPKVGSEAVGSIYAISVTVVTSGTMEGQRAFLSLLEKDGERRALVVSTTFSPMNDAAGSPDVDTALDPDADGHANPEGADASGATSGATTGDDASGAAASPATESIWTMTAQVQVFVAPQSPEQVASLAAELGPTR